ncbi:MAG TPA: basic amino acid ABC transporter substrate-binding protein [Solirubrobacterales bacterium]|jgi:polar amino acid transport system substrate-binding protein|nr:basic amino acid ABC transporter substrate-binding protein [Solirubrobacterales bacterium]
MRKTRLTALFALLAIGAISLVIAGCGSSDDDSTSASTSGGESTEATGGGEPLSVGSDIPYPPFEQGKAGEYTGFDIELMEAIGEKIGRTPEFTDTSFETIFRDVAQGKFEAAISAATITEEREESVAFSDPYYLSEQAILVKEGSDITGLADLSGKTVGAQQGTTGLELGKEKADAGELRPYPEGPDAVNALKSGTVEAVIIDAPVAQNAVEESGGVEIAEKVPTEEEYGIALAKDNTELLEEINTGLAEVIEDGTYTTIYEKWFKLEPPKEIVG